MLSQVAAHLTAIGLVALIVTATSALQTGRWPLIPPPVPAAPAAPATPSPEPVAPPSTAEPGPPARGDELPLATELALLTAPPEPTATPPAEDEALDPRRAVLSARGNLRDLAPTPTPRAGIVTYTVAEGDTASAIAERFGLSLETVLQANNLAPDQPLAVGQTLLILPTSGVLHTVAPGDTLWDIASRYGVIPEDILAVNKLANADLLQPGQRLIIPAVTPERRQAAVPGAPTRPLEPIRYTVQPGDTLSGIAGRFGLRSEAVLWSNDLADPDLLPVGRELLLPPVDGVLHRLSPITNR